MSHTLPPLRPDAAPASPLPRPSIDLRQLRRMTDDTGLIQHAVFATPDAKHGYCIDDNARALIAALRHARLRGHDESALSIHRYLGFLSHAFNEANGAFRNFMAYDRRWLEDAGSEDSQGRTLWALGLAVALAPTRNIRDLAENLYHRGHPAVGRVGSPRAQAFALLGADAHLVAAPDHAPSRELRERFARRLLALWREQATDAWPWWEPVVTYDNAKLPHALLRAGVALGDEEMTGVGLRSLGWLIEQQTALDAQGRPYLSVIGNDGWLRADQPRARFDQQPLEPYALIEACLDAARLEASRGRHAQVQRWVQDAARCFAWFTGRNDLQTPLIDAETGGCRDGLQPDGPNRNHGAESTLAYLLAVLELHRYAAEHGSEPAG